MRLQNEIGIVKPDGLPNKMEGKRSVQVNVKLDCKGLSCPLPIIKTKKAIDGMKLGELLEMTATDPGSVSDMTAWSRRTGHELIDHKEENGSFIFYVKKTK